MLWKAIVIITVMGSPTFQMHDQLVPAGYSTTNECYARTAAMLRDLAMRMPVLQAISVCVDVPKPDAKPDPAAEKPKGQPINYIRKN